LAKITDELASKAEGDNGTPTDPRKRETELRENILVFPFPSVAERRDEPGTASRITGIACELTLGNEVFLTSDDVPRKLSNSAQKQPLDSEYFTIEPGEFAVLIANEYIYLPTNIMGFISMRNRYKQKGLINVSGFHVDPGFRGKLVFTAYNAGPSDVVLKGGEQLFMIMFAELKYHAKPYWGKQTTIPLDTIAGLHGHSVSPRNLDERLKRLETIVTVLIVPLVLALIVALIKIFG